MTALAYRRACERMCLSPSCGSTTRAIRTRAVPGLAWRLRAQLRDPMATILRWEIVLLADCGRRCECPFKPPLLPQRVRDGGGAAHAGRTLEWRTGRPRNLPTVPR